MPSNSIFSSAESEKRWILSMDNFLRGNSVYVPLCVFRVPKPVSESKPEAYAPTQLGLGPLHHLRPDLYAMNNHKLFAITQFLPLEKLLDFKLVVEILDATDAGVRACYDHFLDLDGETLARILATDCVILLHFLQNYREMKHLAGDVLMMENQIPYIFLRIARQVLKLKPAGEDSGALFGDSKAFIDDQSPFQLDFSKEKKLTNHSHLLHRMYSLIVNNGELGLRNPLLPANLSNAVPSLTNIPWATSSEEIGSIPSASHMAEIAGITFMRNPGGIGEVRFDDEGKKFYLPPIKIIDTTEIVLRNLVAYEAAAAPPGATLVVAEYVDLMCGIIDGSKDVDILRKAGIVQSQMTDKEIARIFNGMRKSEKTKECSDGVEDIKSGEKYGYGCLKKMMMIVVIPIAVIGFCHDWFCNDSGNH